MLASARSVRRTAQWQGRRFLKPWLCSAILAQAARQSRAADGRRKGPQSRLIRTLKPCPVFRRYRARSLLGFDEIERALDRVVKAADGYPPYNIERCARDGNSPERLRITLAVAGFTRDQLDVTIEESQLVIRGRQQDDKSPAIHPSRHRRASVPAHLRAGRRHGSAGRGPEERAVVDRSRPPEPEQASLNDRNQ